MSEHKYDNPVSPTNKFGHALDLLDRSLPAGPHAGIHLDIACGFGHIADPLIERFGVEYVGVDIDADELERIRERGHEGHLVDLSVAGATDALRSVIGDRTVVSVSFLDGLEHMTDGSYALSAIGEILAEHRAVAVISVPNVTHVDVGIKNLLGSWTYTEAGLLDDTHYTLYSETSLRAALLAGGLRPIDEYNVVQAKSDQHFPDQHVGITEGTAFGSFVRSVRDRAEPNGIVNQFVWTLASVPPRLTVAVPAEVDSPFLTVIMRTQGRRPQELREAILCLAGQSHHDFELLVIAHRTTIDEQVMLERIIEEQPPSVSSRIRLLLLDHGGRSVPLNLGLTSAKGRYVTIFDDDDVVMANWVEDFERAAQDHPGTIVRGVTLKQDVAVNTVRQTQGIKSISAPLKHFTQDFSLTEHLMHNQSPGLGWAFPRSLHTDFGLTFDESMTTTEDLAFFLPAAEIAGVTDIEKVVAIYRWWSDRESSQTAHSADEWRLNESEIHRRTDTRPFLLPAGETAVLRQKLKRLHGLEELSEMQGLHIAKLERELRRHRSAAKRKPQSQLRRAATPQPKVFLGPVRRRLKVRTRVRSVIGLSPGQPFLGPVRKRLKLGTRYRRLTGRG